MTGTIAMEKIESQREMLNELSYKIWAKPEVGYLEYEACKLSSEALKAAVLRLKWVCSVFPLLSVLPLAPAIQLLDFWASMTLFPV